MHKKNWMAMGIAALAFGMFASAASAEERLHSSNFTREFRGEQIIDLDYEFQLGGMRGTLNSVILIASSRKGRGEVDLVVDGMVLARKILPTRLESVQFQVGRELWPRTRNVSLYFRGNIELAFLGAAVEDHFGDYLQPRPEPRPVPRPEPRPVPGPSHPQMVSDFEFNSFMRDLQVRAFDSDKEMILRQQASFWANRLMTMHQLGAVLGQFRMDNGKLEAVRILDRIVLVDMALMNTVLSKFDFDHTREQARRILMR